MEKKPKNKTKNEGIEINHFSAKFKKIILELSYVEI